MTLLRFVARSMLASYFVVNGVKALRQPETQVDAAEPIAARILPLAHSVLPKQAAVYLPQDTTTLVRCTGAAQILGGLSLATGLGRRVGAGVLAATMVPYVMASNPLNVGSTERATSQALLTKNVALLGGVLLAAQDTEGKPNLAWRARLQKQALTREAARTKVRLQREAKLAARQARGSLKRTGAAARKGLESVIS